jgi:cytochrome b pre-mRNA-processing protein 3
MIFRLGPRPSRKSAGAELYDAAVSQARATQLYLSMRAPDTVEGRFELLTLHVILIIDRLAGEGVAAAASSQALFDTYCRNLDGALREMGVGDLTVSKRMKVLGRAFYGRAESYRAAFAALPDPAPLEACLARMVMGESGVDPKPLADYVARCRQALAACEVETLLAGPPPWPAP